MKNSIGSLAALAAFAAPAMLNAVPTPSPQSAAFENVVLPFENSGTVSIDIDGDSIDDFSVYSNSYSVRIQTSGENLVTSAPLAFGSEFFIGDALAAYETLNSVSNVTFESGYYGFSFVTGGETHAAWVFFDFTGPSPLAVNGGWETHPYHSITVGAIPEPSAAGALAGAGALLGTLALRRRRTSS